MLNLMILHWGEVNLTINFSGGLKSAGVITPRTESGIVKKTQGSGTVKGLVGRGSTTPIRKK